MSHLHKEGIKAILYMFEILGQPGNAARGGRNIHTIISPESRKRSLVLAETECENLDAGSILRSFDTAKTIPQQ
ncbi:MAG: hypothetical protein K0Q73_7702 [Paenibacillus sp.]|jgi:hypothetical protein|nr:hypothetical protein [Paenibacillus sp.]